MKSDASLCCGGISDDFPLAGMWVEGRALYIADHKDFLGHLAQQP